MKPPPLLDNLVQPLLSRLLGTPASPPLLPPSPVSGSQDVYTRQERNGSADLLPVPTAIRLGPLRLSSLPEERIGNYRLLQVIDSGGTARIQLAEEIVPEWAEGKLVVVKRALPHLAGRPNIEYLLKTEAEILSILYKSCREVTQVIESEEIDGQRYIIMEYIEGLSVAALLDRINGDQKRMPTDLAVFVVIELCRILDQLQKQKHRGEPFKPVHRDIKPQNLMLTYSGSLKLIDFGLAIAVGFPRQENLNEVIGTAQYLSPEQVLRGEIDHQTDIFTAGLILYELLTHRPLFLTGEELEAEKQNKAIFEKIITTEITVASLPEEIPADLRKILAKALAHDKKDRYQTAREFMEALRKSRYYERTYQVYSLKIAELIAKYGY
jgi:serine/threonine-protein kinase